MSIYTKFTFKAPELVAFMKELGVDVSVQDGVFTETSLFTLPSGATACIFDEDAWGKTLYGSEDMGLPRCLGGIGSSHSLAVWLFEHLTDAGTAEIDNCESDCEEFDDEEFNDGVAFCEEMKAILENAYSNKDLWAEIAKLDDLIEDAELLYFNYWGGYDFGFNYAEIKNNEMSYWSGDGDEETCDGWHWKNLDGFISLVKEHFTPESYKRKNGTWK